VTDSYVYNWEGLRRRATFNGTRTHYLYNGERVLQEMTDAGVVTATYTTENDSYYGALLHLKRASGESRFPLYDEIGSARGLVDAGGTVTDTYDMDTFGRPLSTTGSTPNPYRYGGAWGYITDPSGLLQLGARFYWPEVGRFVSQDPARYHANWYAYVRNRPSASVDPRGLAPCSGKDEERKRKEKECQEDLDRDLERCERDCRTTTFWIKVTSGAAALIVGVPAACTTFGVGTAAVLTADLAAYTTAMIAAKQALATCKEDAQEDYKICMERAKKG
jgi:RHS repeat-associated protein